MIPCYKNTVQESVVGFDLCLALSMECILWSLEDLVIYTDRGDTTRIYTGPLDQDTVLHIVNNLMRKKQLEDTRQPNSISSSSFDSNCPELRSPITSARVRNYTQRRLLRSSFSKCNAERIHSAIRYLCSSRVQYSSLQLPLNDSCNFIASFHNASRHKPPQRHPVRPRTPPPKMHRTSSQTPAQDQARITFTYKNKNDNNNNNLFVRHDATAVGNLACTPFPPSHPLTVSLPTLLAKSVLAGNSTTLTLPSAPSITTAAFCLPPAGL